MDIKEMRRSIIAAYPNSGMQWKSKVLKMKNNQVIAVYRSIEARKAREKRDAELEQQFHQIDIFEYMANL